MFKFSILISVVLSNPVEPTERRNCRDHVRLGEEGEFPIIMLASLQGSGNTWTRMLIEGATGIYTGSKYNERRIYEENGFLGELENYEKGTTIAIKNHGMGGLETAGAVLLIMRNPYDAFKAEFNRKQTEKNVDGGRSHVGHADPAAFNTTVWDDTIRHVTGRWRKMYTGYVKRCAELDIPIHVIYYEQLKRDIIKEVKSLLKFYKKSVHFIPDHVDERIDCLNQTTMDAFKRKKTPLSWEIYHPNQIDSINQAISEVQKVFDEYDIPEMPYYYKPNYHKMDSDSDHQSL